MAPAQTLRFGQMLIELGDGATPVESFSRPCGLTSKQFSRKAQVGETNVPDCDDEDAPAHIERDTTGFTTDITGIRLRKDASDSSASATMNSPVPRRAFAPLLLRRPPMTKVGS